jgi:ABC-type sugar transport systems, permease components
MPYLLFLAAFGVGPIVGALWLSFYGDRGLGHLNGGAYSYVLHSQQFGPAVKNVAEFLLIFLPIMLATVTAIALVAHSRADLLGKVVRFAYYLPCVVVGAPLVLLWLFLIDPSLSPFASILRALGMNTTGDVLSSSHLPYLFALMVLFTSVGGWVVVLHGALQAVDEDIMEAAALDGANCWQLALHIKVPAIRKYIAFIAVISFAGASQLVVEPSVISQAIPGSVSSTWSLNQLSAYYAFTVNDFAPASVVAVLLLGIGVLAAVILVYGLRGYSIDEEGPSK